MLQLRETTEQSLRHVHEVVGVHIPGVLQKASQPSISRHKYAKGSPIFSFLTATGGSSFGALSSAQCSARGDHAANELRRLFFH